MSDDLPFKVFRVISRDLLGGRINYKIARGAFEEAVKEYPRDQLELRQGTRVIDRNWRTLVVKMQLLDPENAAADATSNCGFTGIEQCQAALSGNGGVCVPNGLYRPVVETPAAPQSPAV